MRTDRKISIAIVPPGGGRRDMTSMNPEYDIPFRSRKISEGDFNSVYEVMQFTNSYLSSVKFLLSP